MEVRVLQQSAICKGCDKQLPAGTKVRFYPPSSIYCYTHEKKTTATTSAAKVSDVVSVASPNHITDIEALGILIELIDNFQCLLADSKEKLKKAKALRRAFPIGEVE